MKSAKKDNQSTLSQIEGLSEVDPKDLKKFEKAMEEKTIPAIVEIVEKRRLSAAKGRHRQLNY